MRTPWIRHCCGNKLIMHPPIGWGAYRCCPWSWPPPPPPPLLCHKTCNFERPRSRNLTIAQPCNLCWKLKNMFFFHCLSFWCLWLTFPWDGSTLSLWCKYRYRDISSFEKRRSPNLQYVRGLAMKMRWLDSGTRTITRCEMVPFWILAQKVLSWYLWKYDFFLLEIVIQVACGHHAPHLWIWCKTIRIVQNRGPSNISTNCFDLYILRTTSTTMLEFFMGSSHGMRMLKKYCLHCTKHLHFIYF